MKFRILVIALTVFVVAACNSVPRTGKPKLKNQVDSVSYALGYLVGNQFVQQFKNPALGFDSIQTKQIARAFAKTKLTKEYLDMRKEQFDTLSEEHYMQGFLNQVAYGKNGIFDEMTADMLLRQVFERVRAKKDSLTQLGSKANLDKGNAFLMENGQRQGVVTTASGLQYEVMKAGNGPKPTATDNVKCTYHGTLIDGTVFDSSIERGDTASFNVSGVIAGWTEALQMMPVGSKYKLFVPANLAYGERAVGDKILPNSTLIFEVELISIDAPAKR